MDNEENSKIYVLNKNEQLVAIFSNDDEEDVLINPRIEKRQNAEAVFTFTIDTRNPKWQEINNPENLYLVDGMVFSTNFDGSFKEVISENDENTIEVTAYERQQLLSRKFVRAWNSETNLEKIDTFMVVILSNGNLPLKNNGTEITTRYPKGSSGYALEALLYGTGWTVGTCDIYEYENGEVVKDENGNPVYSKFDLETDQVNIYDNILKVQELWGGILVFDSYNKIVHHRDETLYLPYNGYEVRYQKNMQSLEKKYNNKIITKLCPLGEGGLNIVNVNDGSVWLENYSYTDTVLEGIENNPDITDQTQLKRWGQRKLEMLCQPTIELDVNLALMYQLEGYELETIDLNHIVDVINYNDVDTDYMQLRVVEFSYSVWDRTDATIKLSNITLDSTDIFRKAVKATNIINTGTLEASKVINIYKGGQSVQQTLLVLDGKTEFTYSELTKADDGIIARVTHTEDNYNTLNGIVGKHTEEIGEWDITSGSISSKISATTSELNTVSGDLEVTSSRVNSLERNISELNSKIQDIADITTYGENDKGKVELNDINESEPIMIKVHPTTTSIDYLYPSTGLFPSDSLYLKDRRIRFERTYDEDGITKTEYIYYELPDGLLRYNDEIYDEFLLDYDNKICQIIKRCEYSGGTGTNLLNPDYIINGNLTGIERIRQDYEEKFTISPNSSTCIIRMQHLYSIRASGNYRLHFESLTNLDSNKITTTVYYLNSSYELIDSDTIKGTSVAIRGTGMSNVAYFRLAFEFNNMTVSENFGFKVMLNRGSSYLPFETYNTIIIPLEEEEIKNYPYPTISLGDGDYKINLLGYDSAYIYVRLMAKNIYTTQFATRAEVHSEIDQTATSITTMVSETYERKDHAESSYSQLQQTASSISATVENNNTKANIVAKINDNTSQVKIKSDVIDISANDVLNILSGNQINLSSKNITINSGNFYVDSNGNATMSSATLKKATLYGNNTDTMLYLADGIELTGYWDSDSSQGNNHPYIYCRRYERGTAHSSAALTKIVPEGIEFWGSRSPNDSNGPYGRLFMYAGNREWVILQDVNLDIQKKLSVSGNTVLDSRLFIDNDSIRSQYIYDEETVSNAPNMYITPAGWFRRTTNTSSERYKTDIKDVEEKELNPEKLYDLPVRQFKYKTEYLTTKEDPRYDKTLIGFIAEEVAKYYPVAVDYEYDEEGNKYIENWNEKYMIPPMLNLIQKLDKRVKILEEKLKGGNE